MSELTKHIVVEIIKLFLLALIGLTIFIVLIGLAKEAIQQGLGPLNVIRLIPYLLPRALVFAIPGTLLLAVSAVYGRMSADNEILALKSLGISPMTVIWPAVALGFVLSLATLWLYELGAVWGYSGMRRVVFEAIDDIVYGSLKTNGSISMPQFSILVKRVEGRKLIRPLISYNGAGELPDVTVHADEAELRFDPETGTLTFQCHHGAVTAATGEALRFSDTLQYRIALDKPQRNGINSGGPAHLPLWAVPAEVRKNRSQIKKVEQRLAARASYQLLSGDVQGLTNSQWRNDATGLQDLRNNLYRLLTEPPRRWATGFSCLCFVCIGVPMAIRRRNADFLSSFFACFLPILLVYYPFFAFGLDQAKVGRVPPHAVWLANVVVLVWGVWLLRRVGRY